MANRFFPFFLTLLNMIFLALPAFALQVPLEIEFARHNDKILAAAYCELPAEYHAYAHSEQDSGKPTTLDFFLNGQDRMPVIYPAGRKDRDIFDPSLSVNIYEGKILILVILPRDAAGRQYDASLDLLLCSSRHCQPVKEQKSGKVPENLLPLQAVSWKVQTEKLLQNYIPVNQTVTDNAAQAAESSQQEIKNFDLSFDPRYADEDAEIYNLGTALFLGVIAGLLLNAMPCVLPVLTMKVSGLMMIGGMDARQRRRRFREHNLCFAAGILTLFTILALLLGAADLMWGQLYQNTAILLIMLLLVFLMGLSMLGVFTLPALDLRIGENSRNPRIQSYFTGLISTFLATPCSGPLLGGVLAWAFTQPMPVFLAVLWAVGLGMALPYIVFAIWPDLAKVLPKPGNWMYVFEHMLGFLLLATALYILSILPADLHIQVLCVLLLASICAWLWGKFCDLSAPPLRRRIIGVICLCLLCGSFAWILRPAAPIPQWTQFTPQNFTAVLGKKNLLVEFTADWCPNCKFLEATVLSPHNLRLWQKKYNIDLIRVDLTRPDSYAQNLLGILGSKSIPLTAIFPAGAGYKRPMVLRDLYGKDALENALKESLGAKSGLKSAALSEY